MRLSHNLASLNIYYAYTKNLSNQSGALNRLTSGKKINSAKDDPNNFAKSEKINMQIRGLQAGTRNSQDGISMLQTAEGGLNNISDDIQRMRQLVVSSGGPSLTDEDKKNIQLEIDQIKQNINSTANNTEFNGVKLLNASPSSVGITYDNKNPSSTITAAVGAESGDNVVIPKFNVTTAIQDSTGYTLDSLDVTKNSVDANLSLVDAAMDNVVHARSVYGGIENRFSDSFNNTNEIADKIQDADSSVSDADIANEIMEYSKSGILVDAGIAMMVQTNKFPQDILNILSRVR
ncbi:flagellin [Clostridium pasteurianum]|uniref:Flagellin n=1 Tax=Clostridium pasteurianum BC1 TaxID=86416 RepID=R4KB72_CLOPA|nr:flagellin [Clostridium pasteurianum]AGK97779.1 flagellin/flagellar hook associated protein [Clostridium pasteurianum BC1]